MCHDAVAVVYGFVKHFSGLDTLRGLTNKDMQLLAEVFNVCPPLLCGENDLRIA